MELKRIALVILNWNGADMLRRFLPSVLSASSDCAEVIVADNGSTDNSCEVMTREFPQVRLIRLAENYGFAEGYNKALEGLPHEFFLLLNSDVYVESGWLHPLLDYMDKHKEAAACQPKLLSYAQRDTFEYAGASGGYIDRWGYPYCRGRLFDIVEKDEGQYDDVAEILWATGAALLIRSEDWRRSGGLDGRFFAHQEEIDLCWRLRSRGRSIVCVPQSKAWHVGGASLAQGNPRKTFLNFRNNLVMLYKNLPQNELDSVLRMRFWLDYLAWLQFLLKGDIKNAKAVRAGRKAYKKMRPELAKDREQNLRETTAAYPLKGRTSFSLLVAFYLKRKKVFSQLPAE